MKKIIFLIACGCIYSLTFAQVSKLNGNFEWAGITTQGWKVVDVEPTYQGGLAINKTWAIGVYGNPLFTGNSEGYYFTTPPDGDENNKKVAAFYNGGGNKTDSWLISPRVDSIAEGDYFCFWIDNTLGSMKYNFDVLISTTNDQVTSFTDTVISFKKETNTSSSWKFYSFSLSDFVGENIHIAFRVYYEGYDFGGGIQIDNVSVGTVTMPNLELVEILSPEIPLQNITDSVEITAVVKNVGSAITSFDMWYIKASAHSYDYTQHHKFERELASLDTVHVTFPKKEFFTLGKRDTLLLFLGIANDVDRRNDTIKTIVDNVSPGTMPYTNGFENADDIAGIKTFNSMKDESYWIDDLASASHARKGNGSMRYPGNPNTNGDDWFFTKLIHFSTAAEYQLSFWYGTTDEYQPQKLSVKWTNAQKYQAKYELWYLWRKDDITNKIPQNNLETRGYEEAIARFTVETPGFYYIAFYCTSPKTTQTVAQLYIDDITIDYAVGINENEKTNEVMVFPNPASSTICIQGELPIQKVEMYNLLGQKIAEQNYNTRYASLEVNDIAEGMYVVKIKTEKGNIVKKINITR
ncbi:MAG: T9SS type A sorting domain-containing protein [Bacteroidales bacterium]|nr:T9SS type A sorting domain-containing protein [Bacteroidales bacterium]